jgi:hypothetical protein
MNIDEFRMQVARLSEVYGEKFFPRPRVELLWNHFRLLHPLQLQKTIDRVIGYYTRTPSIDEIIEVSKTVRSEEVISKRPDLKSVATPRRTPWPASIEAIMLQIESGRYKNEEKFNTSLRYAKLKPEEAWILWEAFIEKDFRSERVKAILGNRTDVETLRELGRTGS